MLTSSQSQRFFVVWEPECINSSVLGDFFALFEAGRDPAVFLERKILFSAFGGFGKLFGFGFGVLFDESSGFISNGAQDAF